MAINNYAFKKKQFLYLTVHLHLSSYIHMLEFQLKFLFNSISFCFKVLKLLLHPCCKVVYSLNFLTVLYMT